MIMLTIVLALASFVLLGASSHTHASRWIGKTPNCRQCHTLRAAAWTACAAACASAVGAKGPVFGPVFALATLMLGAIAAFIWLNFAQARR